MLGVPILILLLYAIPHVVPTLLVPYTRAPGCSVRSEFGTNHMHELLQSIQLMMHVVKKRADSIH